jgi:hypothetical protein
MMTARECRDRSDALTLAAEETPNPDTARLLEAMALEWRKLAIDADWQDALRAAVAGSGG